MAEAGERAMQRALVLLSYRPRSRAELRRRLAERELPAAAIDGCLARLEELGLVDDALLAGIVARDAARFGRSRTRARARMQRLGIAEPDAAAALAADYPEQREAEIAGALARRLVGPGAEDRARVLRLLRGRGFGARACSAALAALGPRDGTGGAPAPARRQAPIDVDALTRLVARRYPGHRDDPGQRRRAMAFVARRGVRGAEVRRILDGR